MANAALKQKRDKMVAALERHRGNLFSFSRPVGGLFIWLQLADDIDPEQLLRIAESNGVSFLPGTNFHVNGQSRPCLRLAFGFPTVAEIEAGIARLADSMRTARGTRQA